MPSQIIQQPITIKNTCTINDLSRQQEAGLLFNCNGLLIVEFYVLRFCEKNFLIFLYPPVLSTGEMGWIVEINRNFEIKKTPDVVARFVHLYE